MALRRGDDDLEPRQAAQLDQRVGDVVAVADVREPEPVQAAEALLERERVGERLAGMMRVREGVHDRHVGRGGDLLDRLLRERPDHDRGRVAREHARRVGDRLAPAELELVRAE